MRRAHRQAAERIVQVRQWLLGRPSVGGGEERVLARSGSGRHGSQWAEEGEEMVVVERDKRERARLSEAVSSTSHPPQPIVTNKSVVSRTKLAYRQIACETRETR